MSSDIFGFHNFSCNEFRSSRLGRGASYNLPFRLKSFASVCFEKKKNKFKIIMLKKQWFSESLNFLCRKKTGYNSFVYAVDFSTIRFLPRSQSFLFGRLVLEIRKMIFPSTKFFGKKKKYRSQYCRAASHNLFSPLNLKFFIWEGSFWEDNFSQLVRFLHRSQTSDSGWFFLRNHKKYEKQSKVLKIEFFESRIFC